KKGPGPLSTSRSPRSGRANGRGGLSREGRDPSSFAPLRPRRVCQETQYRGGGANGGGEFLDKRGSWAKKRAGRGAPRALGTPTPVAVAPRSPAAAASAAATTAVAALLRLADAQAAATELAAVECTHRVLGAACVHLDEREAARAARLAVGDHTDALD